MRTWMRKLRGVVCTGAIWGVVSAILGPFFGAIDIWIHDIVLSTTVVNYLIINSMVTGVVGIVIGSGFATVLIIMEGRKTLDELTPARAAFWGALTGAVLFTGVQMISPEQGTVFNLAQFLLSACLPVTLPALLAAGTVSLARRAPAELDAGAEVDKNKPLNDPGGSTPLRIGPVWRKEV